MTQYPQSLSDYNNEFPPETQAQFMPEDTLPIRAGQEKLMQIINELKTVTEKQKLQTAQWLQDNRCQMALTESNNDRYTNITTLIAALSTTAQQHPAATEIQPFLDIIQQIEEQIEQQLLQADHEIAENLRQAIFALTQSQIAMQVNSHCLEIRRLLNACKNTLKQHRSQG
ncbi:MAG: hypothetical protein ACOX3A_06865 [bacterium]